MKVLEGHGHQHFGKEGHEHSHGNHAHKEKHEENEENEEDEEDPLPSLVSSKLASVSLPLRVSSTSNDYGTIDSVKASQVQNLNVEAAYLHVLG